MLHEGPPEYRSVEHNLKGLDVGGWRVVGSKVMGGSCAGLMVSIEEGRPNKDGTATSDSRHASRLVSADEDD